MCESLEPLGAEPRFELAGKEGPRRVAFSLLADLGDKMAALVGYGAF